MSHDIYDQARAHFFDSGKSFEYGRSDMQLKNRSPNGHTDSSRNEQDRDHDGKLGVDCSSFVWRGLKEAGYDVPDSPFTTRELFAGHGVTAYARSHFDVMSANDARQPHGHLQPGDIVLFADRHGTGQHVGIVRDYDANGHIRFIGSQVQTGPGEQTIKPGGYWDGGKMEIVGALRAKPEFRTYGPNHGAASAARSHTGPHPAKPADPIIEHGAEGTAVREIQDRLNAAGATDRHGHPLAPDACFGDRTRESVENFQRSHGLKVDGKVGPQTNAALQREQAHRLDHPSHPDHELFRQAQQGVYRLDAQHGRTPDTQSDRVAAALTVAAKSQGLTAVDYVVMNDDASRAYAVQGELESPLKRLAEVSTTQALATPLEASSQASRQATSQAQQTSAAMPATQVGQSVPPMA